MYYNFHANIKILNFKILIRNTYFFNIYFEKYDVFTKKMYNFSIFYVSHWVAQNIPMVGRDTVQWTIVYIYQSNNSHFKTYIQTDREHYYNNNKLCKLIMKSTHRQNSRTSCILAQICIEHTRASIVHFENHIYLLTQKTKHSQHILQIIMHISLAARISLNICVPPYTINFQSYNLNKPCARHTVFCVYISPLHRII